MQYRLHHRTYTRLYKVYPIEYTHGYEVYPIEYTQVSEWLSLTAFLGTADIGVHIVHTSRVIIAYALESLSSLT